MRRDEASRVAFALPNKSQQRGVDASLRATQLRKRRNSAALQNLADIKAPRYSLAFCSAPVLRRFRSRVEVFPYQLRRDNEALRFYSSLDT
jgi:hypothetical protein